MVYCVFSVLLVAGWTQRSGILDTCARQHAPTLTRAKCIRFVSPQRQVVFPIDKGGPMAVEGASSGMRLVASAPFTVLCCMALSMLFWP